MMSEDQELLAKITQLAGKKYGTLTFAALAHVDQAKSTTARINPHIPRQKRRETTPQDHATQLMIGAILAGLRIAAT